jgi:23S rRNA pseudouridine2605 synthase
LNQQQLQIARAALWHQTANPPPAAPLLTLDDASAWLDEIGLCLFLPRYTQLPAPAPSFVEACMGLVRAMPPADAIAQAAELAARLIQTDRAIPLNLLGTVSEQPDFLVTPEVLPWVAAVRGDRQWKTAPPGRTTPIVLRTWEALDREGEKTAIEISEILGRELTEAAVLRALIELWTTLRAVPAYAPGQPTRWSLLKNRYPAQLATGANTAQTTALSALLSIYLRAAVAASAEEAEVFLSPLTARSRIREVIHGMTAARQFRTMSVGTQTLLFLEGSLPESAAEPEPEKQPAPHQPIALAPPHTPSRKEPRPTKWELPAKESGPQRLQPRREFGKRPAANFGRRRDSGPKREWQPGARKPPLRFAPENADRRRPAQPPNAADRRRPYPARPYPERTRTERPERAGKPFAAKTSGPRPARTNAKPWQPRPDQKFPGGEFPKRAREARPTRPAVANRPPRENRPPDKQRWRNQESAPPQFGQNRPRRDQRPQSRFQSSDRSQRSDRPQRTDRPRPANARPDNRPPRENRPPQQNRPASTSPRADRGPRTGPPRPGNKFAPTPRFAGPRRAGPERSGPERSGPGKSFPGRSSPGRSGPGTSRPAKPRAAGPPRTGAPSRPFRPGKPFAGKPAASRGSRPPRPGKPFKKSFRKPGPTERNPRKNRSQEENPE